MAGELNSLGLFSRPATRTFSWCGLEKSIASYGDLAVDQHHTVEDVGVAPGAAFSQALGSKRGIFRAGYFVMPMDETLGVVAVDFGGRSPAVVDTNVRTRLVGDLQAELVPDFFEGFARGVSRPLSQSFGGGQKRDKTSTFLTLLLI